MQPKPICAKYLLKLVIKNTRILLLLYRLFVYNILLPNLVLGQFDMNNSFKVFINNIEEF